MKKKPKILKIFLFIILIIIIFFAGVSFYLINDNNTQKNKKIVAVKIIEQEDLKQKKYIIETENFEIKNVKEELDYKNKRTSNSRI